MVTPTPQPPQATPCASSPATDATQTPGPPSASTPSGGPGPDPRLRPRGHHVAVVRHIPAGERWVRLRYFTRRHDAVMYARRLLAAGEKPVVYATATDWREIEL